MLIELATPEDHACPKYVTAVQDHRERTENLDRNNKRRFLTNMVT